MEHGHLKISTFGIANDYAFQAIENVLLDSQELKARLKSQNDLILIVLRSPVELK